MRKLSVSLKELSAIKIGGTADLVVYPETLEELCEVADEFYTAPLVGGGSNVFFEDKNYPVVICTKKLKKIEDHEDGSLTAWCGVLLGEILAIGAGVPATVGGAVLMNFGAFGKEIQEYLVSVEVFDRLERKVKTLLRTDIQFGYRTSSFQHEHRYVLLAVRFLGRDLANKQEYLNKRKLAMPYEYPNLGSVFKNPADNSAGKLLAESGAKSFAVGDARVSAKHANIIVNAGQATALDMQQLIINMQQAVHQRTGMQLEQEVECLKCP